MKIHWRDAAKQPECGDLKVMKDGRKFIRYFKIYDRMYVVANDRNCYSWIDYHNDAVRNYRVRIEDGEKMFIKPSNQMKGGFIRYGAS